MTKGSAASKNLEDKNSSQLDIKSIMEEIRKRISEDVEANKDKAPAFLPIQADLSKEGNRKAGELLYSEELRHLNQNYLYPSRLNLDSIKSHRPGILGKLIVKFKRKVVSILWQNLLQDYFNAEREYQANLVRFLNDVSKYVDERDAAGFWQLVHKVDVDTSKALERVEQISDSQTAELRVTEKRIFDEINKNIAELSNRIGQLAAKVGSQEAELETLDSVARGLEGIVNRMGKNISSEVASQLDSDQQAKDYSYVLLENRFRGKEEAIAERQKFYSGVFKNSTGTVLDIGAGRGELVNILNQDGINSYGIDLDKGMIEVANEKKIDVRFGDGLAHLRSLADNSLGGVIALQVVEHLTRKQLENLFELCRQKVTKDGKIVFETINPKSILALSSNYFRDPTHIWPLHPDTLKHSMTLAGLNVIEVKYLSPVPVEAQLQEIKYDAGMTPKWGELVKLINNNIVQLNELLYGFQDYCIIAEPGE
ncbi:MAG: class I SAM-dependent methyltransferase [Bdellovibrionales bacterium]|nr:class I SAM-dependent methyltransferase [Bdellovibrionales bacterium]